jgi:hypothetical protein
MLLALRETHGMEPIGRGGVVLGSKTNQEVSGQGESALNKNTTIEQRAIGARLRFELARERLPLSEAIESLMRELERAEAQLRGTKLLGEQAR